MVSPLPEIITLAQAKTAARITIPDDDTSFAAENADLELKLEIAHEWCLDYLDNRIDDDDDEWLETILAWDGDNAPRRVKAAILHTFVHLYRFRGDDTEKDGAPPLEFGMPPIAKALLDRLRDPTVA